MDANPAFALEVGLAALRWLGEGYGYEITADDVWAAYSHTIRAAERLGRHDEVRERKTPWRSLTLTPSCRHTRTTRPSASRAL